MQYMHGNLFIILITIITGSTKKAVILGITCHHCADVHCLTITAPDTGRYSHTLHQTHICNSNQYPYIL